MYQQQDLPNPNANNRVFQYTMGRGLGGDLQSMELFGLKVKKQRGLAGSLWNPYRVYKNFNEIEKYNGKTPNRNSHGIHGPVNIRQPLQFT